MLVLYSSKKELLCVGIAEAILQKTLPRLKRCFHLTDIANIDHNNGIDNHVNLSLANQHKQ